MREDRPEGWEAASPVCPSNPFSFLALSSPSPLAPPWPRRVRRDVHRLEPAADPDAGGLGRLDDDVAGVGFDRGVEDFGGEFEGVHGKMGWGSP